MRNFLVLVVALESILAIFVLFLIVMDAFQPDRVEHWGYEHLTRRTIPRLQTLEWETASESTQKAVIALLNEQHRLEKDLSPKRISYIDDLDRSVGVVVYGYADAGPQLVARERKQAQARARKAIYRRVRRLSNGATLPELVGDGRRAIRQNVHDLRYQAIRTYLMPALGGIIARQWRVSSLAVGAVTVLLLLITYVIAYRTGVAIVEIDDWLSITVVLSAVGVISHRVLWTVLGVLPARKHRSLIMAVLPLLTLSYALDLQFDLMERWTRFASSPGGFIYQAVTALTPVLMTLLLAWFLYRQCRSIWYHRYLRPNNLDERLSQASFVCFGAALLIILLFFTLHNLRETDSKLAVSSFSLVGAPLWLSGFLVAAGAILAALSFASRGRAFLTRERMFRDNGLGRLRNPPALVLVLYYWIPFFFGVWLTSIPAGEDPLSKLVGNAIQMAVAMAVPTVLVGSILHSWFGSRNRAREHRARAAQYDQICRDRSRLMG